MSLQQQRGSASTTIDKLPVWMTGGSPYQRNYPLLYFTKSVDTASRLKRLNGAFVDTLTPAVPVVTYATRDFRESQGIAKLKTRAENGNVILVKAKKVVDDAVLGVTQYTGVEASIATSLSPTIPVFTALDRSAYSNGLGPTGYAGLTSALFNARTTLVSGEYAKMRLSDDIILENQVKLNAVAYGDRVASIEVDEIEALYRAGLYERDYSQGVLDDAFRNFLFEDTWEEKRMEIIGNAIRVSFSTFSANTKPFYRPNRNVSIIGGAMTGASVGSLSGNPLGALAGAVIGGYLGGQTSEIEGG